MLYTVTNGSQNPRVIYAAGRGVLVPMGASRPVEMTEAEAENAKAPGVTVEAAEAMKAKAEGPARGSDPTIADVIAMADGNFMQFKSAAAKILGDATPSTKAEIIAALEEKATA